MFAEKIPPAPKYQYHLGLTRDDTKLVADAIARKPELKRIICDDAADRGSLEVLKWAQENGCPWDSWIYARAASNGYLEILKWASANGHELDDICSGAASNGHLEVLKWARENGCRWDRTCAYAAGGGHFEVLKWARENGCPWDYWTCSMAACNGHLEILKWAWENGCECDSWAWVFAALNCRFDVLEWLEERLTIRKRTSLLNALIAGGEEPYNWVRANGYYNYNACDAAVCRNIYKPEGHQRILALFREHGLIG